MRLPATLLLAALLAAPPLLISGCELTPSDVGSSAGRRRTDEATLTELQKKLDKATEQKEVLAAAMEGSDAAAVKAARHEALVAVGKMETALQPVNARKPEFQDRDIQLRFLDEIRRPWLKLRREVDEMLKAPVKEIPAEMPPAPGK